MRQSFYLALKYLWFYRFRTLILTASIGLILFLPIGLQRLITESESQMLSRAASTPLVVGAKGSSTDLVINTLYFERNKIEPIERSVSETLNELGFGHAIPILTVFKARGFPIIGTDLDYFSFRGLNLEQGRQLLYLGECVLGNEVANELGLAVGDHLLSSPENFLDLAGVYPLKMKVVGILDPSQGPDDRAIFTDLKTNWVIMGLGHGHQDLEKINDPTMILNKDTLGVTASAKVYMYNEINPENIQDFHFHGNMEEYPISSAIFVPNDLKSGTILRGRFESGAFKEQMIVPTEVVENLLQTIFRIKRIFNMVFVLVGLATMVIIALIVVLTLRLRKDELFTMFTIGSNRFKVAQIVISELFVILMLSVSLSLFLYEITGFYVEEFIRQFII